MIKYEEAIAYVVLKTVIISLTALTLLSFVTSISFAANPDKEESIKIVVLGDSLSSAYGIPLEKGWVQLVTDFYSAKQPHVEIINASISGETTGGGKNRLPRILQQHNPDIIIIGLGGNDGLRGFPLNTISKNIEKMITLATEHECEVLLLGMKIPPNYGRQYTEQFANIYNDLAEKYDLPLVPFLLEGIALDRRLMQNDVIHPTIEAQPLIKELVLPKLQALLTTGKAES